MKKTLTFCILLVAFCMFCAFGAASVSAASATDLPVEITAANGSTASVTLKDADSDGYYDIGTADELYAFAAAVNGGNTAINGELTKNVTVNANVMASLTVDGATGSATVKDGATLREHVPIGNVDNRYSGYFTGNGNTISGIYFNNPEEGYTGLFGFVNYGARVTDLTLTDSYFYGKDNTGAIAGQGWGRFENCVSYATVVGNNYVGGIAGSLDMDGWSGADRMWGCVNHGDVYGNKNVGGLVGYALNRAFIYYSYNTGDVYGTSRVGGLIGYTIGYVERAFSVGNVTVDKERAYVGIGYKEKEYQYIAYLSDTDTEDGGRTAEAFASGEVAYYLNGNSSTALGDGELYWGQCLSGSNADPHPVYDPTPEYVVYTGGQCGDPTYSNDPVNYVIHDFTVDGNDANGICSCGAFEEAVRTTDQYDLDGDGTKDAVYEIANAGQLLWYAELVNGLNSIDTVILRAVLVNAIDLNPGYDFTFDADTGLVRILRGNDKVAFVGTGIAGAEGGNTVFDSTPSVMGACYESDQSAVTSDVDLSELRVWTPIANGTYQLDNSIFDGQGYTVSGLFTLQESNYVGLFGEIAAATVKNVTVCDSLLYGTRRVGGVVGYAKTGCVIENCHNTATVLGTSDQTGGIVGGSSGTNVTACSNSGTVSGTYYVGGVVGYNSGSTVQSCYNTGIVSGTDCVGGVVGDNRSEGIVTGCYNTGNVSGTDYVGGVVGYQLNATAQNCYNTGTVSGTNSVGGVVGDNRSEGTVTSCYNTGNVSGENNVGGVVGDNSESTVQSCYYLTGTAAGGIDGADAAGQAEGKTAEQFASGEVAYLLQGGQTEQVWGQSIGTDSYPVLGGARVYYGYTTCDIAQASPIYTNDTANTIRPQHDWRETAHDGTKKCIVCGKLERHYTELGVEQTFTDAAKTHVTVSHTVINPAAFHRDSATITFSGGFLSESVTLGLYNGKLVAPNGSLGAQNTIGYIDGQIIADRLYFRYAFPCASAEHPVGETVVMQYTIRFADEDGHVKETSGSFTLQYINYQMRVELTDYGATLNLTFYATQGNVIKTNAYDAGTYTVHIADHYGGMKEYQYIIDVPRDTQTSVTREDTASGTVIRLQRADYNRILVTLPEGAEGVTVEGNGTTLVTVTVTASVKFSYSYMDHDGNEYVYFIAVDRPTVAEQDFSLDRLGYTTVDFEDSRAYALATDGVTKYRNGTVTVYLTNCVFKATGKMVYFTFIPGGAATHTFSKEDILLIEQGAEVALTEDITVSLGAVLVNDHVFLPATCTVEKTCQYCGHTEGEALGHDMQAATCTAPSTCTACGNTEGEATGEHSYDNACDTACNACGETRTAAHVYDNACDTACNACGAERTVGDHADADENGLCDVCNTEIPKDGLSGGAIAGIVIGAVAVVGLGVFVLFWFVIKKKK